MINPFKVKKLLALTLSPLFVAVIFYAFLSLKGFLWATGSLFLSVLIFYFISSTLIKNPFTSMLEGKGILVADVNSTGIVNFFIIGIQGGKLKGWHKNKEIDDIYDRDNTAYSLNQPEVINEEVKINKEKGRIEFSIPINNYNKYRFGFAQYPMLFFDSINGTFLTKDAMSHSEKNLMSEHLILTIRHKIVDLNEKVRDFGRSVIDQLRPKGQFFKSGFFWVVLIIGGIILLAIFAKPIMNAIGGFGNSASSAVTNSVGGSAGIVSPTVP